MSQLVPLSKDQPTRGDGCVSPASSPCSACSVGIVIRPTGQLQIHNSITVWHIQPPGSHITHQQRSVLAPLEPGQHILALTFVQFAMQAPDRHAPS